jgi:D-alanyl-D-alanine carboxypeptidase
MQSIKDRRESLLSNLSARSITALVAAAIICIALATESSAGTRNNRGCFQCAGGAKRKSTKSFEDAPCHSKKYVNPKVAKNFKTAVRDLKRSGISPHVTSAWRSTEKQSALYRCSQSKRCRRANPGLYYALPPGQSLHEAGFAVDISGVAAGPRGAKRITPRGRRIIGVMRKNGFQWRYGLKDPAHFEANPRRYGYRSAKQAISRSQSICDVKIAKKTGRSRETAVVMRRQGAVRPVSVTMKTRKHNSRA